MMIEQVIVKTKILENPMSLHRSCIDAGTLTMDGAALPGWLTLDALHGTVERVTPTADDKALYTFVYEHFRSTVVDVQADKAQIAADGIEQVTLTVTCEDTALASVPVACLLAGINIGTVTVNLTGGVGGHALSASEAGTYRFEVDTSELDPTWNIPAYAVGSSAIVEAVNA